jgi:hypothetical protein
MGGMVSPSALTDTVAATTPAGYLGCPATKFMSLRPLSNPLPQPYGIHTIPTASRMTCGMSSAPCVNPSPLMGPLMGEVGRG